VIREAKLVEENLALKSFIVLMKSAKSVEQRIKKDIRNYGIATSEFTVLETLYHKGKQTVQQISNAVLINSGSITYVIDKLEAKNFIGRNHCKEDRRVVHIQITDTGKQFMDEVFPKHQKVIEEIFEDINTEERTLIIDILKRVGLKAIK
jgi:MarR family 2-MHQ and catechol resistance regulon transcriptional repressor